MMDSKLLKKAALWLYPVAAFCGLVIFPLRLYFISDTVLSGTLWLDLFDLLFNWAEPVLLSLICAFFLFGVYRYGTKNIRPLILLCAGAVVLKYVTIVISDSVLMGSLDLTGGGLSSLISLFAEAALAGFILLLAHLKITPRKTEEHVKARAAEKLGKEYDETAAFFPFSKLIDFKNPLLSGAFFGVLIITVARLANFIVDDLTFGQYEVADIPYTLLYVTLDVLIPAVLGFFIARAMLSHLMKHN